MDRERDNEVMFTRFERLWHWTQALLILGLAATGFEVFGSWRIFGYGTAVELHQVLAWTLLGLWVLFMFWHMVTGEWRQYVPTLANMGAVIRYYTSGIFDPRIQHPYKPTRKAKHNPLQRLAYGGFLFVIMPALWVTGLLYMVYNDWEALGLGFLSLAVVALAHVAAAFALVLFFVGHVYMAFTGRPATAYLKAMITGRSAHHAEEPPPHPAE